MEHAFEVYTQAGIEIARYPHTEDKQTLQDGILQGLEFEPWYRVRYHVCRNQERKPCEQWYIVAEHGDVPEDDE